MDPVQLETVELDEGLWQEWIKRGKRRDERRKRRWRVIGAIFAGLLLLSIGIYRWVLPS